MNHFLQYIRNCALFLLSFTLYAVPVSASEPPEILRVDTIMQDHEVRVTVAWNSEVPVVRIIASGGRSTVEIDNTTDSIINKRTARGNYTGSKSFTLQSKNVAIVKSYKTDQFSAHYSRSGNASSGNITASRSSEPYQEIVVVTVQLVDKYGKESALLQRDVPTVIEMAAQPAQAITSAEINLAPTQNNNQIVPTPYNPYPQSPVDAAIGLGINASNQLISAPQAIINTIQAANGKILITASATAPKSIQQFMYQVIDSQNNNIVISQPFSCNGGVDCKDRRSESDILQPGTYKVVIKVRDNEGREGSSTSDLINIQDPNAATNQNPAGNQSPEQSNIQNLVNGL